jgi:hypothetical protein
MSNNYDQISNDDEEKIAYTAIVAATYVLHPGTGGLTDEQKSEVRKAAFLALITMLDVEPGR